VNSPITIIRKDYPMNLITVEEKADLMKNLLADPNDWISYELLRLSEESDTAMGLRDGDPVTNKP
jgi:hypothetical protein